MRFARRVQSGRRWHVRPRLTRTGTRMLAASLVAATVAALPAPASASTDPTQSDGGLVFAGADAALPTAPTDVWSATRGRTLATIGTSGTGPSTCVIDTAGEAVCSGWSGRGQLGIGTKYQTPGPAAVTTDGALAGRQLTAISSGGEHACALDSTGRAYCWGASDAGQVGSGTRRVALAPVAVDRSGALDGTTLTAIAAGGQHTCALATTGRAYCWGRGREGQLGNGGTADSRRPVAVDASGALQGRTLVAIATGAKHTCAVDAVGAAFCWGAGAQGQLGSGTASRSTAPVRVSGSGRALPFEQISAGREHTCALSAGVPYCWGDGSRGQLGTGSTADDTAPVVTSDVTGARSLSAGDLHTCVTTDSDVLCWGAGTSGQLGNGDRDDRLVPTPTLTGDLAGESPGAVAATALGTCVLSTSQRYYCWGYRKGMLPDADSHLTQPTLVDPSATALDSTTITALTDDAAHTCAIADGAAYCWGYGSQGQLGTGQLVSITRPTPVYASGALAGRTLVDITAGEYHTCALDSAGRAYCWGSGDAGQLGDGDGVLRRFPRAVDESGALAGKTLVDITAGDTHTCALDSVGRAYCWGSGFQGQLGVGKQTARLSPAAVSTSGVLAGRTLVAIDAGYQHTCALDSLGQVFCWGSNAFGQLGDGSTTSSTAPVAVNTAGVLADRMVSDLSAGDHGTCALSYGRVYCWGVGWSGLMGNGTEVPVNSLPVAVDADGALAGVTLEQLSVGGGAACTASTAGRVYCWGAGSSGQLGVGSYSDQLRPAAMRTSGVLADVRVRLLGASFQTWLVTAPQ